MSETATPDAIEAVARDLYGRLVAYIASRTGDKSFRDLGESVFSSCH
jgi:hypothetical protein